MKFKFNKRLLILTIALIFFILSVFSIRSTYSRYITSLTTKSYVELGSWLININEQDIMENSDFSNVLTPTFDNNSDYIAENKLVPTSTGYVELNLDYSNVKVPFSYEITFTPDDTSYLEDLVFKDYSIDGGAPIEFNGSSITYTIIPDDVTTTQVLKLNFVWLDGNDEALDDIEDTKFSNEFDNTKLHFNISFTQLQDS